MVPAGLDFSDRNAVEKFLQTDRFRPCANLECSPAHLQHVVLYTPVCMEGRFNREGVAQYFDMPVPARPLSPVTYTTVAEWGPLVSCPRDCKGYRNRTVAKILATGKHGAGWFFHNIVKPTEVLWAAFWARVFR
jgi:hypothetical protein